MVDDDVKMVVTMAPQEYQMNLVPEQRYKGSGLTLEDIESAMSQQWRSVYDERISQNLGGNEDCNSKWGLSRQFNGTCHKMWSTGPQEGKLFKEKGQNQSRQEQDKTSKKNFIGTGHLCGKVDHKKENCWLEPENTYLCPAGFQTNGSDDGKEQGAAGVDRNNNARTNNSGMKLVIPAIDDCQEENTKGHEELSMAMLHGWNFPKFKNC